MPHIDSTRREGIECVSLRKRLQKGPNAMSLSRRSFTGGLLAAPFIGKAQSGPLKARVKIDTERVIGDIDPKIYGNFIEHLGRCIDGGIFEEKSRLSDAHGFRRG